MTIYERGNAAKQWMLADLDRRFGDRSVRVLDLAGGSGRIWQTFLASHPNLKVVVIDTDEHAIARGKRMYEGNAQMELRVFDAQHPVDATFDVVTAMSAIEHVVDRPAFLKTAWSSLSNGGIAYMNYDVGHFRSSDVKERIMVPVSQLLARFGIEGPYMKKVDDALFRSQAEEQGFTILSMMKHNLGSLKGCMRNATDEQLALWFEMEDRMNAAFSPERLDAVMFSTTLVLQKP
jgi:ubiquinone/menaquinone biosynthesis C-methylase UbiE